MSRLALYLLGPPRVELDDKPTDIRRRKAIALLVYLAVTGQRYSRDALATLLWPELDQSRARAGLRRALTALRKALGEGFLDVDRETVGLNPEAEVRLDVDEFHDQLAACRTHDHPEDEVCSDCLPLLAEAAALYRDDFLAGFTLPDSPDFDEWQFFETEGLRDRLTSVLERLAFWHGERGEYEPAIAYARRWQALDLLHEPAHRCLVWLYALSGQQAAALRQYEVCRKLLAEELGVEPSEQIQEMHQLLLKGEPLSDIPSQRPITVAESQPERYRFERKISSKGSFGEFWLATDTVLERPVAVKCPKATHDPSRRERFLTEARMLARLNHHNITQVYDAFFDEGTGRFHLVMEYVDGKDLGEIIEGGIPLPLDWVLDVARGILQALSYVHDQGIVHRDIKPDNVMIGDDVKLTDFGLANLRSILEEGTDFIAGTVGWLAPEQIEGRTTDGRADLYALGVTLFEMLSGGRLPFEYAEEDEILDAHLHADPPPVSQFAPDVPPVLEQVITRLLAKDPEDRYPSADAVIEALDAIHVGPRRTNLPVPLTPFVGREAVLAEIKDRLEDPACRLLTLIGTGGCGKTRLALKAAGGQLDSYPHGVFFVSLAPLDSTEAIVPTVAEALGFAFYEGVEPRQQLLDYLRQKSLLLIMDNYEHLLEGAGLVTEILKTAPDVRILATSRTRLNVGGEHRFQIAGMDFPELTPSVSADAVQYSAVKLFLQGARRAQPGFELTDENLRGVTDICRLVEGMPLAVRLAAAWVEVLSPQEIATEISQGLDFLETDLRDVPERQRSVRAVFDHSWRLLTEREREVFQELSIFRGGFTREAAQEVTGASLRELLVLADKSLLQRASVGRFELHELLRKYGAEKLVASPAAQETACDRHSAFYAAALQQWGVDLKGPRQQMALAEMDVEIENARAAWNWAVEHRQVERLAQAIDGLCHFYEWRGRFQEGESACRLVVNELRAAASGDTPVLSGGGTSIVEGPVLSEVEGAVRGLRVLAKALAWHSLFSERLGRAELASQLLRQSLALLERPELAHRDIRPEKAFVLLHMGKLLQDANSEEARRLYEQSLALYRALGDRWGMANTLSPLAWVTLSLPVYEEAQQLYEESLALRRALGDQRGIADALSGLGMIALHRGRPEEAARLARESLEIRRKTGDQNGIAVGQRFLGGTLHFLGKHGEGHTLLEQSMAFYDDVGNRAELSRANLWLGYAKALLGQYEQAHTHGRTALALARDFGSPYEIGLSLFVLGIAALGVEAYAEAQQVLEESVVAFQEVNDWDATVYALPMLGYAARGLGQVSQARRHLCEVLRKATEFRAFVPLMFALPAIPLLLADRGREERAVELYALASRYPFVANSKWFEDVAGKHIAAIAATLPPEAVAAARERGRARDLEATVAELLDELEG